MKIMDAVHKYVLGEITKKQFEAAKKAYWEKKNPLAVNCEAFNDIEIRNEETMNKLEDLKLFGYDGK